MSNSLFLRPAQFPIMHLVHMRLFLAWLCLSSAVFATPAIAVDVYRGIVLPAKIAGFQRGSVTDNEATSPGLGLTISYAAPGIKATVFVYDRGIREMPEGADNAVVHAQARQSFQDIGSAYSDVKVLEALAPGAASCAHFLRAKVSFIDARNGEPELMHSFLYFGSRKGNFVKVRLTYAAKLAFATGVVSESRFTQALCASVKQRRREGPSLWTGCRAYAA